MGALRQGKATSTHGLIDLWSQVGERIIVCLISLTLHDCQAKQNAELVKNLKGVDESALAEVLAQALAKEAAAAAAAGAGDGSCARPEGEGDATRETQAGGGGEEEGAGTKRPAEDGKEDVSGEAAAAKRARLTAEASPQIAPLDDDAAEGVSLSAHGKPVLLSHGVWHSSGDYRRERGC